MAGAGELRRSLQMVHCGPAAEAAKDTGRGNFGRIRPFGEVARAVQILDVLSQAHSAAVPAGAAAVLNELVALDEQRIGQLDCLDRIVFAGLPDR
jgi:hypothetical protein